MMAVPPSRRLADTDSVLFIPPDARLPERRGHGVQTYISSQPLSRILSLVAVAAVAAVAAVVPVVPVVPVVELDMSPMTKRSSCLEKGERNRHAGRISTTKNTRCDEK
jgi:hypothetical protein